MYRKKAHVHFVGIGGIGMSGIATILKYQGYEISGCDLDLDQHSIQNLKDLGCHIYHGNNTPLCHNPAIDILVYSSAVHGHSSEIVAAQQRGIPTIPRALMLAELMRTKYSIAIAGAHGKTTTTSLISHILMEAELDPTIVIGGHLKAISNNARFGKGDFLVAEADESDRSLVRLQATLAVVTNIDREHLDTYKDLDDIKATFKQFLANLPFYGKAFLCVDDEHVRSLLPMPDLKIIKYGLSPEHKADLYASDLELGPTHSRFNVWHKDSNTPLGSVHFAMPGRHNAQNALAALAVSLDLGISFAIIAQALNSFKGVERRFSYRGTYQGAEIFDDYGHHPKELANTFLVARNRTQGKVIVVFQPHRYSRTDKLWNEFIETFTQSPVDHLIITDIYPASEAPIPGITSQNLMAALKEHNPSATITYIPLDPTFQGIMHHLEQVAAPGDLILLQGAGKINKLATLLNPDHYTQK